ncbi:MAG: DUF559 domain-containing protein [Actinomycetia bacterium]|nr:DUF559 domain-containing protein [Actinomycetes bacterium]
MGVFEPAISRLSLAQAGGIGRGQLADLGMSRSMIDRAVADGRWKPRHSGVLIDDSRPATYERELWAAFLALGPKSLVGFDSAARTHGLRTFERAEMVRMARPHGLRGRLDGVVVHQIGDHAPEHVVDIGGLPVTTPARTVVDLAMIHSIPRLKLVVEDALARSIVDLGAMSDLVVALRRRGKPGITKLTIVLDELASGDVPPESLLERKVLDAIRGAGLPEPAFQAGLPGRALGPRLVDFAFLDGSKLIVEADGRRWHARNQAMSRDRERDLQAARLGWQTLRVTWEMVMGDPVQVGRDVAAVHTLRLRG